MTGFLLLLQAQGGGLLPPTYRSLFADWVARKKGDVVNVLVIETAKATGLKRERDIDLARRALEARGFFSFLPRFSASHSMEQKTETKRERAGSVERVAVTRQARDGAGCAPARMRCRVGRAATLWRT